MQDGKFLRKYGAWALVTGASSGIGEAFARQLAEVGMNLVVTSRGIDRLTQLAEELRAHHKVSVLVIAADLSSVAGLAEVESATRDLDTGLLVACAGFGTSGPLLLTNLAEERSMLALNCYAVLQQCMVFGNRFVTRGRGGIILMSSLLGWQGVPQAAHYAATKAYVQSLAEALQLELEAKGVDVLASAPGPVHSGFAKRAGMQMSAAISPSVVAQKTLAVLGRKGTVVPGALSKLLTYSLLPLPRPIRTRILAQVMTGMTKHQNSAAPL